MVGVVLRSLVTVGLLVGFSTAHAQVGITASGDGRGERLEQKRLELSAEVNGHFAKVKSAHIFKAGTNWRTELDIIYTLPDGAIPTDFAYYYHGERVPAFITEKERAKEIYKNITTRMQDPALIEFIGKKTFRVRIFPVEAGQDLRMEVGWIQIAKTVKGVPTFEFPIKMRKEDPMSEVSATVRVTNVPWLKSAMESIGLKSVSEGGSSVFSFDQKAVRPRKDWLFSLVPLAGQKPLTVVSGRSGSEKGYAAVASGSGALASGLNSPMTMNAGGTTVVSGTYGTGSSYSQEVVPNHLGLKVWAYQRIRSLETSAKNRDQVVAMSLRHNLISKFTSWIAIPTEERKRFEQMIKEARTSVKVRRLVEGVRSGKIGETAARTRYEELKKEIKAVSDDPEQFEYNHVTAPFVDEINDLIYSFYDGRLRPKPVDRKRLLRTEALVEKVTRQLKWFGIEDGGEQVAQLDGYTEHKINQLLGRSEKGNLDWGYVAKHCPTLMKLTEASAADTVYRSAAHYLIDSVRQKGIKESDQGAITRLALFREKHGIRMDVDALTQLPIQAYDNSGDRLPAPPKARIDELAYVAARIGFSTEAEFMDVARYHELSRECQSIVNGWAAKGSLNQEELIALKKRLDTLSPRMADQVVERILNPAFQPWSRLVVLREESFKGKTAYLEAYRAKLEEHALVIPKLTDSIKVFVEQAKSITESAPGDARWEYLNALGQLGMPQSFRDKARVRLVKQLNWFYEDEAKAESEAASVQLPIREKLLETLRGNLPAGEAEKKAVEKEFLADPTNSAYKGETYGADRMQRLKIWTEIEGLESTGASTEKIEALKKELEPIVARMGDPLLSASLPADTQRAVAIFPWGEVRTLTLNPKTEEFQVRFDIPPTATEGNGSIVVVAYGAWGVPSVRSVPLTVDNTAPSLEVASEDGRLVVRDPSKQVVRVKVLGSSGETLEMVARARGEWISRSGIDDVSQVRVFAFDRAHNVARYIGADPVIGGPTAVGEVIPVRSVPVQELAGSNIQAVAVWRGIEFAATLDEGLFYRQEGGTWTRLEGLPSQAARQFVPVGEELAIRFGSGDLVMLNEKLEHRSLNSQLPRQLALSIASDGKTLAVAQTGGFSLFGDTVTHEFDLPKLSGGAPSAVQLADGKVRIGMQGRGFFEVDLGTRTVRSFSEADGLMDDWVTAFGGNLVGTFAGGAYRLDGGKLLPMGQLDGMQITGISKGGLVATRSGLFRVLAEVAQIDLGAQTDIQGVAESGDSVLLATRNGVYRFRF